MGGTAWSHEASWQTHWVLGDRGNARAILIIGMTACLRTETLERHSIGRSTVGQVAPPRRQQFGEGDGGR
jgi:hypothetical protein